MSFAKRKNIAKARDYEKRSVFGSCITHL